MESGVDVIEVGVDGFLSKRVLRMFENVANESGGGGDGGGDGAGRDRFDVASDRDNALIVR